MITHTIDIGSKHDKSKHDKVKVTNSKKLLSTDGQTDKVKPVYPTFNFTELSLGIKMQQWKTKFLEHSPEKRYKIPLTQSKFLLI